MTICDHFYPDKGACKTGGDCLCLPKWGKALCDQGKQILRSTMMHCWLKQGIKGIPPSNLEGCFHLFAIILIERLLELAI